MLIPRSRILLSQEVLLMALRPPSAFHWPRELRLMLLMPIFAKAQLADAHDAGLGSAHLHFWSQEVMLMFVIHWPRELRLMLMMPVFTPVSEIHLPQDERLMLMMLGLSAFFLSREVLLMVCERRGG